MAGQKSDMENIVSGLGIMKNQIQFTAGLW